MGFGTGHAGTPTRSWPHGCLVDPSGHRDPAGCGRRPRGDAATQRSPNRRALADTPQLSCPLVATGVPEHATALSQARADFDATIEHIFALHHRGLLQCSTPIAELH